MPVVRLHGPLKKLAGGAAEHSVAGSNVLELLQALERDQAALAGWIVDERGSIRRHLNVYVNGERGGADTAVMDRDKVEVLPAISGG